MDPYYRAPCEYLADAPTSHLDVTIRLKYLDQPSQDVRSYEALQGESPLNHVDQQQPRLLAGSPCMTTLQQDIRNLSLHDPVSQGPTKRDASHESETSGRQAGSSEHDSGAGEPGFSGAAFNLVRVPAAADPESILRSARPYVKDNDIQTTAPSHTHSHNFQEPAHAGWSHPSSQSGPSSQDRPLPTNAWQNQYQQQHQLLMPRNTLLSQQQQNTFVPSRGVQQEPYVRGNAGQTDVHARVGPPAPSTFPHLHREPVYAGPRGIQLTGDPDVPTRSTETYDLAQQQPQQPLWQRRQDHRPDPAENPALLDYQMQLLLLEQYNKKRLMMARAYQDEQAAKEKLVRSGSSEIRQMNTDHQDPHVVPGGHTQALPTMPNKQTAVRQMIQQEQYQQHLRQYGQQHQHYPSNHHGQYMTPQSQGQIQHQNQAFTPQPGGWLRPPQYIPDDPLPLPSTPLLPLGSGNHALQDYQMQLMLLEQQSKKRQMIKERKAQDEQRTKVEESGS